MRILQVLALVTLLFHTLMAEELDETAKKIYLANINTLLIFTSQNGLSSGTYNFDRADVKMQVYNLPFNYHLDPFYDAFNLVIFTDVGYSEVRKTVTLDKPKTDLQLTADNKLSTYVAGIGAGVRYQSPLQIDFLLGLEVMYSRVSQSVSVNDDIDIGDAINDFFSNNYNENYTYKFIFISEYVKEYKGFKPYVRLGFKYFDTKADFSFKSLSSFTTQSSTTNFDLGAETPNLYEYNAMYLTLEGYIKANYINGGVTDVVGFDAYSSVGAVAYWYIDSKQDYIKRLFVETNTVNGDGVSGYNLAIGFSLAY